MKRTKLAVLSGTALVAAYAGQAQTLYWGGGAADITGPQALPTELGDLTGTWNTTLQNWAVDAAGTTYQTWSNSGTNRTARIGHGLTTDAANATITLGADVSLNVLDIRDPKATANKNVTFAAPSPMSIALNGATPTIDLRGGVNWQAVFPANASWSGTAGLRFLTTGSNHGWLSLYSDASALTGTLQGLGGQYSRVSLLAGSKLGIAQARFTAGRFVLQSANGAANPAFPDNLTFVSLSNLPILDLQAYGGATPSTETIGQVVLDGGFATLDASSRSGSAPNGRFIFGHATAGIDRGRHGKGMFALVTQSDDSLRTDIEVANGLDAGIIPWAMTSYGRLVELDDGKVLRVRLNTDAPADVTTWAAGSDYRLAAAPAGTLAGIVLNSLTAYFDGISPTLAIEDGATLTLTRGLLGLQRTGTVVTWTISGGTVTTPADTLYVNQGTGGSKVTFDTQLDGAFDLVLAGYGAAVEMKGSAANTYSGTTYSSGTLTLRKPTASAPAIPGDLVVLCGTVEFSGSITQNQIARYADVTIEALGKLAGGGNAGTQDFGGVVTINGGTWLGNYSISHHAFDAPGFGLCFNGGRFGVSADNSTGNYYLLTDVSYAAASGTQAVFQNNGSGTQVLHLTESGKGSGVRTFAVTNSAVLAADVPEMVMDMALYEANTSESGGLTKAASGTLALQRYTQNLTGPITVDGGALLANAAAAKASVQSVTFDGTAVVVVGDTTGMIPGQRVNATGLSSNYGLIVSVDSATQITLDRTGTAGTRAATFLGGSAVGAGAVTVNDGGTFGGTGVAGAVTVKDGGALDPAASAGTVGTLVACAGVTFEDGATWHVDIADENAADMLLSHGDLVLAGTVAPAAVGNYAIPSTGEWLIATATGTISSSLAAPAGYTVKVDTGTGRVWLSKGVTGTAVLIR
jgi:autotransporter-associated beta strand protein